MVTHKWEKYLFAASFVTFIQMFFGHNEWAIWGLLYLILTCLMGSKVHEIL